MSRKYYRKKKKPDNGKFASKLEKDMWEDLSKVLPSSFSIAYETVKLPYVLEKNYVPDFVITRPDGTVTYLEIKGYFRPTDRAKLRAVRRKDPSADVRLVFSRNNKISSRSPSTYGDWCDKNGFVFSVGSIPIEWFSTSESGVRKSGDGISGRNERSSRRNRRRKSTSSTIETDTLQT